MSLSKVNQTSQTSFDSNHKLYDSVRPGYPLESVSLAVKLNEGTKVLELASGTGKFTAYLAKHLRSDVELTVAEPSGGMLETFRRNFPQITAVQAAANDLPFSESSFDTIYIAQAFHWFANRESLAEIARVLRSGGQLVLVWNYEDLDAVDPQGWQTRTTNLFHNLDGNVPQYRHQLWKKAVDESGDLFALPHHSDRFPYTLNIPSPAFLWDYWASRSYVTALSDSERDELRRQFDEIMRDAPAVLTAARGTDVVWLTRR